jgi:hydroxymethylpyrimidine/phosphomethylpyrimidine kinase
MYMKKILTIAGHDPSSGAGITRDLDIYFSLGIHGISVPTCIVLQGPKGVKDIYPIPREHFSEMLKMAGKELDVDGVKIGVVWDVPYIDEISAFLRKRKIPVVVDPMIASKNGKRLITDKGLKQLIKLLFPMADIITPNVEEASIITGNKVKNLKDMERCTRVMCDMGPKAVVVKGGHLKGEPVDLLFDGKEITIWEKKRIEREVHGTGCMFSSLLISFLIHGYPVKEAFLASEEVMEDMLKGSYRIDKEGYFYASSGILNSGYANRWKVLHTMKEARKRLYELNIVELIPEVQMNIGYAVEGAKGIEDVAAFPGRIGQYDGKVYVKGEPQFGASSHVARLILTFMKYYPHVRSCVDIRYDRAIIKKAKEKAMDVVFFDRRKEPKKIKGAEGKSLDFLVEKVLKRVNTPPDIIYDVGDVGKEPIIRLFAKDPLRLIKKMEMIIP